MLMFRNVVIGQIRSNEFVGEIEFERTNLLAVHQGFEVRSTSNYLLLNLVWMINA